MALAYQSDLGQFLSFLNSPMAGCGPLHPAAIDALVIQRYLRFLDERKNKPSTRLRKLASLRSFYNFLVTVGSP